MIIFGITGTIGAGKGTIVDYLVNKNFKHFSVRAFLTEEIKKRKLPVNRDNMVIVANELRKKHSPAYIVEQLYNIALATGDNCVIESIRTPGEVELLRSKENFYLLAVDALAEKRYDRIVKRKSETDNISFTEFLSNEKREMESDDPNKQNLSKCIEQTDYKLINNTEYKNLYEQIEKILKEIKYYG
ncbi:MAG: AAA family ATPase [Bacteroidota bacterium]|nr:AAA family ATPase [Bacteroidota bacterium]